MLSSSAKKRLGRCHEPEYQERILHVSGCGESYFIAQGNGGKIINIASMLSFGGGIRVPSYTASKSGVMGVTRLMANEWAKHNINVNAIAPGYMATNNTQQLRADEQRSAEILDRIPAGRWGLPSDLMGPVVFLASSASDYVNGYTIAVDGGWLAQLIHSSYFYDPAAWQGFFHTCESS